MRAVPHHASDAKCGARLFSVSKVRGHTIFDFPEKVEEPYKHNKNAFRKCVSDVYGRERRYDESPGSGRRHLQRQRALLPHDCTGNVTLKAHHKSASESADITERSAYGAKEHERVCVAVGAKERRQRSQIGARTARLKITVRSRYSAIGNHRFCVALGAMKLRRRTQIKARTARLKMIKSMSHSAPESADGEHRQKWP